MLSLAMLVVAGLATSHSDPSPCSTVEARLQVAPGAVKKGHVLFHHCLTWHGSPPNHSERGRPGIAVHYMPGWTRYEKEPGREHLVEHHITVKPGEVLKGDFFPTVMENGTILKP